MGEGGGCPITKLILAIGTSYILLRFATQDDSTEKQKDLSNPTIKSTEKRKDFPKHESPNKEFKTPPDKGMKPPLTLFYNARTGIFCTMDESLIPKEYKSDNYHDSVRNYIEYIRRESVVFLEHFKRNHGIDIFRKLKKINVPKYVRDIAKQIKTTEDELYVIYIDTIDKYSFFPATLFMDIGLNQGT